MIVKLLTENLLEFLNLKGGCRGLSESTHVKMPNCWKSHATAQLIIQQRETNKAAVSSFKCCFVTFQILQRHSIGFHIEGY